LELCATNHGTFRTSGKGVTLLTFGEGGMGRGGGEQFAEPEMERKHNVRDGPLDNDAKQGLLR